MKTGAQPVPSAQHEVEVLADELRLLHDAKIPDLSRRSPEEAKALLREHMHRLNGLHERTALCLSGGGIRSATFNLGVLQGLARRGLLGRIHYLSTVSGGGYVGSWLTAWLHNEQRRLPKLDPDPRRSAVEKVSAQLAGAGNGQAEEPDPIRRLRAYSSYLSPVRGVSGDALTVIAIFLRNLLLNWLILVPLLAAGVLLPRIYLSALHATDVSAPTQYSVLALAILGLVVAIAFMASDLPSPNTAVPDGKQAALRRPTWDNFWWLCTLPLLLSAVSISILLTWTDRGLVQIGLLNDFELWFQGLCLATPMASKLCGPWIVYALAGAVVHVVGAALGTVFLRRVRRTVAGTRPASGVELVAIVVSGGLGGVMLGKLLDLFRPSREWEAAYFGLYATWAVPALLFVFWFSVALYAGWRRRNSTEEDREWWARGAGNWLGAAFAWLLLTAAVVYLPGWILSIPWLRYVDSAGTLGGGAALLGILTSMAGFSSRQGPAWRDQIESVASRFGIRLLELAAAAFMVILIASVSYGITCVLRESVPALRAHSAVADQLAHKAAVRALASKYEAQHPDRTPPATWACGTQCASLVERAAARYQQSLHWDGIGATLALAFLGLVALALTVSKRIGVNAFSLNSLYGNRLVRAYLGASRNAHERRPHWYTGFDPCDNVAMADLPGGTGAGAAAGVGCTSLYPVVNMALNLVTPADNRLDWQDRKAASFTVTPRYAGSSFIGFVPTQAYMRPTAGLTNPSEWTPKDGITLGHAMTISGAAASPNMGYHSSSLVAFVMAFFNVRLGAWVPNPGPAYQESWRLREPRLGLKALLDDALGRSCEKTPFVSVSDGGHFDNLGLYEMVRRRCSRIVVCDATCDPQYSYGDLENVLRKIRVDLGIAIEFPNGLPTPSAHADDLSRMAIGRIRYDHADAGAADGVLYYIKPIMRGDEPLDVRRYAVTSKTADGRFPQQQTADQFYDEAQFESYRVLGLHTVLTSFPVAAHWPGMRPPARRAPDLWATAYGLPLGVGSDGSSTKGDAGKPKDPSKLASGVAGLARTLPPASWLAPLAVAGAVGVTGVVSLSNPEVRLAPTMLTLDTPTVKLDPSQVVDSRGLTQAVDDLRQALAATSGELSGQPGQSEGLNRTLSGLNAELRDLRSADLPRHTASTTIRLREFNSALSPQAADRLNAAAASASAAASAMAQAARGMASGSITAKVDPAQLDEIEQALKDIRGDVSQLPPRRNIRGTAEGAR